MLTQRHIQRSTILYNLTVHILSTLRISEFSKAISFILPTSDEINQRFDLPLDRQSLFLLSFRVLKDYCLILLANFLDPKAHGYRHFSLQDSPSSIQVLDKPSTNNSTTIFLSSNSFLT